MWEGGGLWEALSSSGNAVKGAHTEKALEDMVDELCLGKGAARRRAQDTLRVLSVVFARIHSFRFTAHTVRKGNRDHVCEDNISHFKKTEMHGVYIFVASHLNKK